ncbi:MAG: hypothetical protein K8S98_10175 [Planctomycetes bacterium]|nr:hypothetical protein [Planctomycetota bacterium]
MDVERTLAGARPAVFALLALTLVLQLVSWSLQTGYPLADAVEYLDRASLWVDGSALGGDATIRSFAFSALFVPLFAGAKALGVEDPRGLMTIARVMQLVFGLAFVWSCARLGARVGGKRAGLAAGAIAACNPIFLIHAVWPVADIAAATMVALALEVFVERSSGRRAFQGGVWLGLAFLFAYKVLLLILLVLGWILVRDRLRRDGALRGAVAGVALALAFQVVLDRWVYGEWGSSLWRYIVDNTASPLATLCATLHLRDAGRWIYELQTKLRGFGLEAISADTRTTQLFPRSFYATHVLEFLPWPVLALTVLGVWRVFVVRITAGGFLIALLVVTGVYLSLKGDKSFRLWLPLLPATAVLGGLGCAWLMDASSKRSSRGLALMLVGAALVLGPFEITHQRPHRYAAYWEAMEIANHEAKAHAKPGSRKRRIASAFYWTVFLRNSPTIELLHVWPQLNYYTKLPAGAKKRFNSYLDGLDGLLMHLPAIEDQPELLDVFNSRFSVLAACYEPRDESGVGPVYVLRGDRGTVGARRFFEIETIDDPEPDRVAHRFGAATRFSAVVGDHTETLSLLGVESETLAGSGFQWLTYHWFAETDLSLDCRVVAQLRPRGVAPGWVDEHAPARDVLPTSQWKRGTLVREGRLLAAGPDAAVRELEGLRLGADAQASATIPVELWIRVRSIDGPALTPDANSTAPDADGFTRVAELAVPIRD